MSRSLFVAALAAMLIAMAISTHASEKGAAKVPAALNFKMNALDGKEVDLGKYQGKVLMVVNVASKCGFTPQYEQLQALHQKYGPKGLAVLGFPCNQFKAQEPGTAQEIQEFCRINYGVTFPLFAKIAVNGDGACPLYKHLTSLGTKPKGPGKIDWNFEKFVIGRNGNVVARFAPKTKPDAPEVIKVIEAELATKSSRDEQDETGAWAQRGLVVAVLRASEPPVRASLTSSCRGSPSQRRSWPWIPA